MHWRFRVLIDAHSRGPNWTWGRVVGWRTEAELAIREILGTDSKAYGVIREVDRRAQALREDQTELQMAWRGLLRGLVMRALVTAADEDASEGSVRVVDLHPWIAESAEALFDDGHYSLAILAASRNLEVQWRKKLRVSDGSLSKLATESFSADDPQRGRPRLRFPKAGSDTKSGPWKNAHIGAMTYAQGCAMRIRNLNLHHPENGKPEPGLTIETLSALSLLARWVTEAEVQVARPPWMDSPTDAGPQ